MKFRSFGIIAIAGSRQKRRTRKCREDDVVQKMMLSAYFSHNGFVSIELRPQGQKDNSQFFAETLVPSFVTSLPVGRPRLKATLAHIHINNAKHHNSQFSI
jgi:hypothetical protein